jgi:hypothetical protein
VDEMDALKAAANSLLKKAQGGTVPDLASAVEKATGVFRLSADLEKSKAEVGKLALEESKLQYEIDTAPKRERSERIEEYVTLITPVVTIMTLAATLLVQGMQFSQSEKDKREATEDAQWDSALKLIAQSGKVSPTVIALNPFLNSPKYRGLARETAIQLLANSSDPVFFTDLFSAAFVPIGWSDLNQVAMLDRALAARANPLYIKIYDEKRDVEDLTKLTPEEKEAYQYVTDIIPKVSAQVASVLKAPRTSNSGLDLSATRFKSADWGGVDLSGANRLRGYGSDGTRCGLRARRVDLKGANLETTFFRAQHPVVRQFEGAIFPHVACGQECGAWSERGSLDLGSLVSDGEVTGRHRSLSNAWRTMHIAVLGKTGSGKSSSLRHLAQQDIAADRGFLYFDIHGNAKAFLLRTINARERQLHRYLRYKLVLIDPADPIVSVGLNPLEMDSPNFVRIAEFVEVLKRRWSLDHFGARTDELLRNALYVLAANHLMGSAVSASRRRSGYRSSFISLSRSLAACKASNESTPRYDRSRPSHLFNRRF